MNETLTKLATYTVSAGGGDTSVTFNNIPQNYTDLRVIISAKTTGASNYWDDLLVKPNGVTSGATTRVLYSANNAVSYGSSTAGLYMGNSTNTNSTASAFASFDMTIFNYTASGYKYFSSDCVTVSNVTNTLLNLTSAIWTSSVPITSLTFSSFSGGNFIQNSEFTLYGVKNMAATIGSNVKATGGAITFDGTYVYHTFNSTGAFTPAAKLTADVLVVAGGGAGGGDTNNGGGGGGAGGLIWRPLTNYTPGASYVASVGAGGTGASATTGGTGTNTVFDTITALGGGGGGAGPNITAGASGGSGGGGGGGNLAGGSATQGNSGGGTGYGNAGGRSNSGPCGGGGGAGAAGTDGINATQQGGNGGNGLSGLTIGALNWMGAATSTGQLSGGNYYYAGGGAGNYTLVGSAGLGGGGVAVTGAIGGNGTSATGGGGAGSSASGSVAGGNGGSGVVIVRYKA